MVLCVYVSFEDGWIEGEFTYVNVGLMTEGDSF